MRALSEGCVCVGGICDLGDFFDFFFFVFFSFFGGRGRGIKRAVCCR